MADGQTRVALLAGASGLTGAHVLNALLAATDFSRVIAVTRRPLQREHARLANRIVQFDRLESQLQGTACDVALCCLGSTRAQAGSREAFRKVDVDYVVALARAALAAGAQRFVVVSSAGADPRSRNFYLRTKGEMEEELEGVGFAALDILEPGLLLGWRHEMRPLELAAMISMPLVNLFLTGRRAAYRGISVRTLAAAVVGATRSGRKGVQRYKGPEIHQLARLTSRASVAMPERKPSRAR